MLARNLEHYMAVKSLSFIVVIVVLFHILQIGCWSNLWLRNAHRYRFFKNPQGRSALSSQRTRKETSWQDKHFR